jgi:hypothetical protein
VDAFNKGGQQSLVELVLSVIPSDNSIHDHIERLNIAIEECEGQQDAQTRIQRKEEDAIEELQRALDHS